MPLLEPTKSSNIKSDTVLLVVNTRMGKCKKKTLNGDTGRMTHEVEGQ